VFLLACGIAIQHDRRSTSEKPEADPGSLRTACGCQKLTRETDDERNSRFPFGYRALSLMERK
jgi:hypothetical protein